MLRPRWHKVLSDVWGNKTRSLLVVMSIAIGVFAVGMMANTRLTLSRAIAQDYAAIRPASAALFLTDPLDEEGVETVRRLPDVLAAEGRRSVNTRVRVGAAQTGDTRQPVTLPATSDSEQWRNLQLLAIPDFENMRVDKLLHERGAWPPPRRELIVERSGLDLLQADVGDLILVETSDGRRRALRIAGVAHDLKPRPSTFTGNIYGYVTFDTLEWLGEPRTYSELRLVINDPAPRSKPQWGKALSGARAGSQTGLYTRQVTNQVRDHIEQSGRRVRQTAVYDPGRHWSRDAVDTLLLLLTVLGVLILFLSGILVINTISALLVQQTRQIGMMKAIGARSGQITRIYLGLVLALCVLALLLAIPSGALGALGMTRYLQAYINFDPSPLTLPAQALALQVSLGLLIPLITALAPILNGVRITAREALSSLGMGNGVGDNGEARESALHRLGEGVHGLSRPVVLALRNTVRGGGRLRLAVVTLTIGGGLFVAVNSVHLSLNRTVNQELAASFGYDIGISFSRPYRTEQIEREALALPGVAQAEAWGNLSTYRLRPDGSQSNNFSLVAPPAQTSLIRPQMLEGRWLQPEDENALVVNTEFLNEEPDVRVGDEVTLRLDGRDTAWRVVGVARSVRPLPIAYANYTYFARVVREVGRASNLQVVTTQSEPAFQYEVALALEEHWRALGLHVSLIQTTNEARALTMELINMVATFLMIMALLLAVVGGLGLTGMMSINVLERTREIGVMRAVGAPDGAVLQVVMVEGLIVGLLSWALGGALSLPLSRALSNTVGRLLLGAPLIFQFSASGVLTWLVIVLALAALASFMPAWNAVRLTVRDVLAYE